MAMVINRFDVFLVNLNPTVGSVIKKTEQIVLDQIRTIDRTRLIKKLGMIEADTQSEVISVLQRLFAFYSTLFAMSII